MNENLKKLISSGAIKKAREEDEAKARNEEIQRQQRMENFEDFSEHYGTKPKNVDTTTSTTSTTRFDSTAKRNNNYKAAQTGSESAFAVEEAAPSSIKKASGQKAGFENRNNNYANSNVFGSNKPLDNNALPAQNQSFMESAKTNFVTKTKNAAAAKNQQKTTTQRDAEIDALIDEKFGKGTAQRLKLENPVEFQNRMAEVAGKNKTTVASSDNIFDANNLFDKSSDKSKSTVGIENNIIDSNALPSYNKDFLNNAKSAHKTVEEERLDSDTVKNVNEFKFSETAKRMSDDELKKALDTSANPNYRQVIDGIPQYEDNDGGERQTYWNELNNRRYNNLDSTLKHSIVEYSANINADLRQNIKKALSENYTYTDDEINDLLDWSIGNYTPGTQEAQYEKNHPIIASAESVISNLFNGIPASIAITGAAIDKATCDLFGLDYDEKSKQEAIDKASVFLNTANRIRSNISKDLELNYSANIFGVNLASFGYNTFMSIADNVARMVTGAAIGAGGSAVTLSLMATNAGSSYAIDTLNNGGNIYQAISMGVISGALEWFTEKIPLESLKLLKEQGGRTIKTMVKNTFKQMAVEGTEEGISNIGDAVADYLINGENSEYYRNFNEFKKQGYSDETAHQKCFEMLGLSFAQDVAGGIVSGGVLGGGAVSISNIANRSTYQSAGRQLKANTESAVKDGAETTPIDELRSVADQYGVKYKKAAERMSDVALGKFQADVYDKINEKGKQEIISAYAERIKELDGDSPLKAKNNSTLMRAADRVANDRNYKALGEIVAKASVGAELTKTEKARLNNNAAAKQVLYEIETVTNGNEVIRPLSLDSLYDENLKYPAAANMALYAAKKYKKGSAEYNSLTTAANELSGNNTLGTIAADYLDIADTAIKLLKQEKVSDERYNKLFTSREGLEVFSDLHKLFTANAVTFSEDMSEEERIRYICNSYDPTDPRYSWLNKVSEAVRKSDAAYDRLSNTNYLYNKIFGGEKNNGSMSGTASVNNADNSLFSQYEDGLGDNGRAMLSRNATTINYATDEQRQIYADRMKMAYNNAMNGYSLQRVIDEGKRYGLSEKQARAAYDAGKADRALKVKRLYEAMNSRRVAARIRSGNLYINDEQLGMLNEVGNSHLKSLEAVSAALGLDIRIVTDKEASALMMNSKAKGMYSVSKDAIYISIEALNSTKQSVLYTVGHEATHFIQDYAPATYEELRNYVIEHINKAAENGGADIAEQIAGKVKFYEAMGQRLTEEDALDEIVAEYFCDMLDNNELIGQLANKNYNLFEKVCKALSDFIEKIRNTLHELMSDPRLKRDAQKYRGVADLDSDFAEMQALWNRALEEAVAAHSQVESEVDNENVGGDRYEINPNFEREIDNWYYSDRNSDERFVLGSTSDVLQGLGARENDVYMNSDKILTILKEHPEMSIDTIKRIPEILENPILILKSKNDVSNNSRIVIFGRVKADNGKPVLCVLDFLPIESKIVLDDMQKVTSSYTKTNGESAIKHFFEKSEVLYTSKNKKITANLLTRVGFCIPTDLLHRGYIGSITYGNENVKIEGLPFNEVFSYDTNNYSMQRDINNASDYQNDGKFSFGDEDEVYGGITVDMTDGERYEVLKDKKIQPQKIEIDNDFDIDFDFLENNIKSIVEKPLKEKLRQMGVIGRKYKLSDIDLEFEFTANGYNKSIHSQEHFYGGNLGDFAKVVLNMQKLLDKSVLLDIHSDKAKGSARENPQLARTYVLFSAFRDGEYIKPVQFEVKQYVDNNNRLYVAVALTKIETGVKENTILDNNQASTTLPPVSDISISEIFKNVNPKDRKFLKYIPNQFLSDEQIKAKRLALREDDIKYGRGKDGKYSFGDEDERLLNDLDLILDNEDEQYSAQKDAYGKKVKHRVNSIEKYAESEAIRREAEDSLVNAGGKRAGESNIARAKSDAAIKIGNASKDDINPNPSKIERQNSQLKFENAELKRQMKPGVYAQGVNAGSVMELAKRIVKETKLSAYDIARRLNTAYKNISLNYGKVTNSVIKYLQSIAETIYYNASVKKVGDEFEDIKTILKSGTMTLSPQDRADMGDYNAFRQKYQNSLGLRNEGGTSVDSRYEELTAKYPYLFPDSITHPADRLKKIADVYDSQKPRMVNPYEMSGYSKQDIIDGMVNQFINEYNEKKAADPTFVDKAIEALNKEKARLNEGYKKRIAENREEYLNRARKEAEADKEQYRRYREEREKTQTKKQIRRLYDRLIKYTTDETNKAYVPKDLYLQVAEICKVLSQSLTTSTPDSNYNRHLENSFVLLTKLENVFKAFAADDFNKAGDDGTIQVIKDKLSEFKETFVDENGNAVNINALDSNQLRKVYYALRDIIDTVRDSVRKIGVENAVLFAESGDRLAKNQREDVLDDDKKRFAAGFGAFLTMNPMRVANVMSGYNKDGELNSYYNELNDGVRTSRNWRMNAFRRFSDYENGNKSVWYYHAGHDKIKTSLKGNITLGANSVKSVDNVELTKMQIMQLIMSYEREQHNSKLNHLMKRLNQNDSEQSTGGAILVDADEWNKGHYDKAVKKAVRVGRLDDNDIRGLKSLLDDESLAFMKLCRVVFNEVCATDINKVSLLLHKGIPALEEYYLPFVADNRFVFKKEITPQEISQFNTIENSGFLKSITAGASQPIDIMGLDVLVKQHIEQAAKVVGLAIPIRNFNKFYNAPVSTSTDGTQQTVKSVIEANWGSKGTKFIEQTITDLQTPRTFETVDKMMSKARGLMVAKALVGNISVVIKQAASYFTAGSEISAKSLTKAILSAVTSSRYKAICAEIDEHTAAHYDRRQGMSTQELGDLAQSITLVSRLGNKAKYSKINAVRSAYDKLSKLSPYKWIQGMDCLTTAALWNAAKYEVQSLNKGIDTNSKLYWDKVTELYDRTIENTQPMYDSLHKAEVSKSRALKNITMFQTQPLQNYGILRERLGELQHAMRTGEGKSAAKRNFAKAAVSQTVSLAVFAAMTLAAAMLTHRVNPYREDEGEDKGKVTWNSVFSRYISDVAKNGTNLVIPVVGSNVFEYIASLVDKFNGKEVTRYWELNDNVLGFAEEYLTEFQRVSNKIGKLWEENSAENWQSLGEESINGLKLLFALGHIPAENLSKLFGGVYLWVKDKQSGDWFNSGYNMPYGEYDMLGNDSDSEYIRNEADRLEESLGIDEIKLDNAAEKSVTVHGESKKLSRDEYEQYSKTKSDYCKQLLLKVMKSGTYGKLSDGLKAEAINEAKSLGGTMAKGDTIDGYSTDGYEKAKALEQYGVPLEDQILSKVATSTSDDEESNNAVTKAKVENKKALDSNGDGSVTVKEKIAAIEKLDISDGVKKLLIAYYKANAKKKKELIGMSGEE